MPELEQLILNIHPSWNELFVNCNELLNEIIDSIDWTKTIYPLTDNIFRVFEMDVLEIKLVLLGQDPYHNPGQAIGLSFAVNQSCTIPPSLYNIFKELRLEFPEREYKFTHGDLSRWFYEEKIFLLNAALTVEINKAGSHSNLWKEFTNQVIEYIALTNNQCVFLLLGSHAKNKMKYINDETRCVCGVHPSPLAANKGGFFNSGIFREIENKLGSINWTI